MSLRIFGAIMVVSGCGGFGVLIAAAYRREVKALQQLLAALDYMQCELQYRLTPLPELCRQVAAAYPGLIRAVFASLATELEDQISPDVSRCMRSVLSRQKELPQNMREALEELGQSMGRFDMEGQLRGMEMTRRECRRKLDSLLQNQTVRLRSYQTLSLCAGAALAILFI